MLFMSKFKIIEGGIKPKEQCEKVFLSSYITDTRLMGVMALFVRWEILNCKECDELVQFFIFDTEEFGLEGFENIWGYDKELITSIENTQVGPLGGKKVPLKEHEVLYMVKHFHNYNLNHKLPLPKDHHLYQFILDRENTFDVVDLKNLQTKFCTTINSNYEAINYCLMRIIGKDFMGASYVSSPKLSLEDLDIYPQLGMGTFHKNTISQSEGYYLCQSIVSVKNQYYICRTNITVEDRKVTDLDPIDCFPISDQEAAMILSTKEYISFYKLSPNYQDIESMNFEIPVNSTCHEHLNGDLFLMYKNNNRHVDSEVFWLKNDIYGAYFINTIGQFIISAPTKSYAIRLQAIFEQSSMRQYMELAGMYEFQNQILYDYIDGPFDDFESFIKIYE